MFKGIEISSLILFVFVFVVAEFLGGRFIDHLFRSLL